MYTMPYLVDKSDIARCSSNQQLREIVNTLPNGSYANRICMGCGCYSVEQDAHVDNAEIVQMCPNCWQDHSHISEKVE